MLGASRAVVGWCAATVGLAALSIWVAAPRPEGAHRLRSGLPRPAVTVSGWTAPTPPLPSRRQQLVHPGGVFHLYPPVEPAPARASAVLMLHGMCSDALATCDFWSRAGREGSFLLCPEGNARCGDYGDWQGSGEQKARFLDEVLAAARSWYGSRFAPRGDDILIGFSRGAFVARDVAYARPGRFRGLILIGAALKPDPDRLRAAGIRRVVLAAGEYDCARPTMQLAAAILAGAGVESRYVSLGKIYHQLPADLEAILREAIAWIRAAPAIAT